MGCGYKEEFSVTASALLCELLEIRSLGSSVLSFKDFGVCENWRNLN